MKCKHTTTIQIIMEIADILTSISKLHILNESLLQKAMLVYEQNKAETQGQNHTESSNM